MRRIPELAADNPNRSPDKAKKHILELRNAPEYTENQSRQQIAPTEAMKTQK
jgi:hypothetical protein